MYRNIFKRVFDIFASSGLLIILLPIFIVLIILVRYKLGKPVIFKQIRPGLKTKPFEMFKFRTMTNERDENGNLLSNEKRLTRFGKKMRSSSLDELPELINVIKGDMSLVGPRPLRMKYLKYYTDYEMQRHEMKPGITGWAQVNGRSGISWEKKLNYDVWYVKNVCFWLDIKILFLTIIKTLSKEGADLENPFPTPLDELRKENEKR